MEWVQYGNTRKRGFARSVRMKVTWEDPFYKEKSGKAYAQRWAINFRTCLSISSSKNWRIKERPTAYVMRIFESDTQFTEGIIFSYVNFRAFQSSLFHILIARNIFFRKFRINKVYKNSYRYLVSPVHWRDLDNGLFPSSCAARAKVNFAQVPVMSAHEPKKFSRLFELPSCFHYRKGDV